MDEEKEQTTKRSVKKDREPGEPLEKSGTTRQPIYKNETGSGAASGDPTE